MFDLTGKKALVTGASGGLGRAIAKCLKEAGADVALSGTRVEALEAVSKDLGGAPILPCKLNNAEDVEGLIGRAEKELSQVDILVNNAGLTRDNLLLRMKNEDFEDVIDVNLQAPFLLMRHVMRGMMKRKWGRIVNVSSVVGVTGNPGQANYCASKAGLIGMSKSIAQEVASRHITVNCIAPGFIASAMTESLTDQQKSSILAGIPQGEMGSPEDIGAAVVYLSSQEARYVTGQTFHVNGGMAMI